MPRIVGTGLVALDFIVQYYEADRQFLVGGGGTCGNVLSVLARAGWQSSLIGALDDSVWSNIMRSDLNAAGVETHGLLREASARPSLIVEHLERSGTTAGRHWFDFVCPRCKSDWPGLHAAPDTAVRKALPAVRGQDVLFVDRLSDAVMDLVRVAKAQGSVIVYEPSAKADRPWVADMLQAADVVKYSDERAAAMGVEPDAIAAQLVVVTAGDKGAWWRLGGVDASWRHQSAMPSTHVVDTCGAGDWFTAGLLHGLYGDTRHPYQPLSPDDVAFALAGASTLAAWSCGYVGARGALYDAAQDELAEYIGTLTAGSALHRPQPRPMHRPLLPDAQCHELASICGF